MADKEVMLDGQKLQENEIYKKMEEAKANKKLIKEITPGTFKTLQQLRD